MLTWLSRFLQYVSNSLCPLKFVTAALFAKLASLCLPSVSPQSPLLALCLLFCLLALACSCCLAWFPLLLHHAPPLKALSFTVLKRMREHVATKEFVRRLRGSVSQNVISDLVWTSFAPRSDLVKIAASQNPAWRGFGKALPWSAAWSAAVVACAAASGQGTVFGRRTKRFVKGWKLCGRNQKHKKIT